MNELSTPRRSPKRRLFLGGGLATAVAGAAAAAIVATGGGTAVPAPANPSGTGDLRLVNAAQVLNKASEAAAAEPDLKPKPGQYLYFSSKSHQGAAEGPGGETQAAFDSDRSVWLSVNGAKAGYLEQGEPGRIQKHWLCDTPQPTQAEIEAKKKGERPAVDLADPPTGCVNNGAAYRTDVPTDPAAAKAWLYKNSQGGNPPDVQAFVTVGDTIREHYIGSRSLAALFKAAADIPGVKLYKDVVDLAGRKGVAVGQTYNGLRNELIFDPATFKLLGERSVWDSDTSFKPDPGESPKPSGPVELRKGIKNGDLSYAVAYLGFKVVDTPGQR